MGFKTVSLALAADLVTSGTITLSYPTGTSKGNFDASAGHYLYLGGNRYDAPKDFTLAFNANASGITLTWNAATTVPQGTVGVIQLEMVGEAGGRPFYPADPISMAMAPLFRVDLGSPRLADADGVCASQSVTAGAEALINGVFADANDVAVFDVPRNVVAGWTTSAIITVTGEDEYGQTVVEKSGSGTTFTGKKAFKKVTSVTFSENVTGATVGDGVVLGLPVHVGSVASVLQELEAGAKVSGGSPGRIRIPFYAEQVSVLAGTTAAIELISPVAGVIKGMTVVTRVAVGTGGAVTAAVGTTAVDGLSVTVADSSTKGTTTSDTPTAGHASTVVARNSRIQIIFADAMATTGALDGYIEIEATNLPNGDLVVGATAAPSATSADVRGTYAPVLAPDGSTSFALLLALPDPAYKGSAQYAG